MKNQFLTAISRYSLFLLLAGLVSESLADSWPLAKEQAIISPNGKTVVRIIPGKNMAAVYGYAGRESGTMASAIYYNLNTKGEYQRLRTVFLQNPIAPLFAAVSDNAELITLDNWHNVGIGDTVIVIYQADGSLRKSYSLSKIYTQTELAKFERSVSSIRWRCNTPPQINSKGLLEFSDTLGKVLLINPKTGELTRDNTGGC